MTFWTTLWWLLCAHALTDYVLQSDRIAELKHPSTGVHATYGPWWWWMIAHGLINALGVLYVTQNVWLSVGECVVHMGLDTLKSLKGIDANTDQAGHLASKAAWAFLA
jgi:hypothetical protein